MIAALVLILSGLPAWLTRDTNSHAANVRGVKAYQQKKFGDAAAAFSQEGQSPRAFFNLGTAQVAAGNREQGSSTLSKVLNDPKLRGDAFFNRGNSALSAKAYDYAIHDFAEALKANPRDVAAKRNLEIALAQKRAQQQQQQQRGGSNKGQQPSPGGSNNQQPQAPQRGEEPKSGDANAEALLRSVQQQEKEELSRMHRARPERARVGW